MDEEQQKRRDRLEERVLIGSLYGLAGAATAVALALPTGGALPAQDTPSVQPDQSATDNAGNPKLRERREALRKFVKTLDEREGSNIRNGLAR